MSHIILPTTTTVFVDIGIKVIVEKMSKAVAEEISIRNTKITKTDRQYEENEKTEEYTQRIGKYSVEKMNRSKLEESSSMGAYSKKAVKYKAGSK